MPAAYFREPVIMTEHEIRPGDIYETEFGDYGVFCEFVFEKGAYANKQKSTYEIQVHQIDSVKTEKVYACNVVNGMKFKVVGREY